MSQTTVESIEDAMKLVDAKKQKLKEAYEKLRSHSSRPSLNFTWSDLDSYITSYQTHLTQSLSNLRSQIPTLNPKAELKLEKLPVVTEVPARPELKSLCEKNDGLGLRNYVIEHPRDRASIRVELFDAFRHAPDAGSMVLDALSGFWEVGSGSDAKVRTACVVLLEEFMGAGLEIGPECRSRAASMAIEWKGKILGGHSQDYACGNGEEFVDRLAFLHLLASYKLLGVGVCSVDEVVDCLVEVSKFRQAMHLCRRLGIENKVSDVVKRLINEGKQLLALKFIMEFEITDEFSPVALLKDYFTDSKKNDQQVRKIGENSSTTMNDTAMKEINAIKSVIKFIEDHCLESEYPKGELLTHLEKLEKEKAIKKRPATNQLSKGKNKPKQPKQKGNKRLRAPSGPSGPRRNVFAKPISQPSAVSRARLLPTYTAPYLSSTHGVYGHVGSDPYGSSGSHMGYYASPNLSSVPNPYPSELHAQQLVYYGNNGAVSYSGPDVESQYHHPAYYPQ